MTGRARPKPAPPSPTTPKESRDDSSKTTTRRRAKAPARKPSGNTLDAAARSTQPIPTAGQQLVQGLDGVDAQLISKWLPWLRRLRTYTRLHVDGLDNVPKQGPCILAANHTGWLGLDYALTALTVHDGRDRLVRGMVHKAWFRTPVTAQFAASVGLVQVSKQSMAEQLAKGHAIMVFPEGEKGAFRPGGGYAVQEFARGFVRVAAQEKVPIVPVAIVGGEEANPVDRTIDTYEKLLQLRVPVPKNIFPRPVKWRIRFLAPHLARMHADDADAVRQKAHEVRLEVQEAVHGLLQERGHPYW